MYPSEPIWWQAFEDECAALYVQAGQPVNWGAFRWSARTAYDIAAGVSPARSRWLHLNELRAALNLPLLPIVPMSDEKGIIRAQGTGFVDEDGAPWLFTGYSVHCLLPVAIKDEAQAHRIFEAMDRYGANIVWLFGTHLSQWKRDNGYYHDPRSVDHPTQLARLFDIGAEHRKRFCYGLFADAQSIPVSEQQALWARDAGIVKGRWNVNVYTIGNEADANGWNSANFSRVDAGQALLSKGDMGGGKYNQPPRPYWDVNMWEGRTTYGDNVPDHKALDDVGTGIRELQAGYTRDDGVVLPRMDCPLLMMETDIYNDVSPDGAGDKRNTRPSFALAQGVNIAANCAGGCFGSSASLEAKYNGPVAEQCAREWFRGMWAGFVR